MELSCVPQVLVVSAAASKMLKEGLTRADLWFGDVATWGVAGEARKVQAKVSIGGH